MFKQSAEDGKQSPEPPLMEPGELPDSERSKQPPLPESPYRPYPEEPASELPTNLTKTSSCGLIAVDSRPTT
jgi:hypothetical protein